MNELGVGKLVEAALNGVKQARGTYQDGDALCALGVLGCRTGMSGTEENNILVPYGVILWISMKCPLCGDSCYHGEAEVIAHLNDDHELDFLGIARKLAPQSTTEEG